jgi:hypothetical protein
MRQGSIDRDSEKATPSDVFSSSAFLPARRLETQRIVGMRSEPRRKCSWKSLGLSSCFLPQVQERHLYPWAPVSRF